MARTSDWLRTSSPLTRLTRAARISSPTAPGRHLHRHVVVAALRAPRAERVVADAGADVAPPAGEVLHVREGLLHEPDRRAGRRPQPQRHLRVRPCPSRPRSSTGSRRPAPAGSGRPSAVPSRADAIVRSSVAAPVGADAPAVARNRPSHSRRIASSSSAVSCWLRPSVSRMPCFTSAALAANRVRARCSHCPIAVPPDARQPRHRLLGRGPGLRRTRRRAARRPGRPSRRRPAGDHGELHAVGQRVDGGGGGPLRLRHLRAAGRPSSRSSRS